MRKICFDEKTVADIRNYIQGGHTKKETCNRFNIKIDTLNRVMEKNGIEPYYHKGNGKMPISEEKVNIVCNLFTTTMTSLYDICRIAKIKNYTLQEILKENFTQEQIDNRKSKMYANSKLGDKNPMTGKRGCKHHLYKGVIEDGKGYLMVLKPDWYTGRYGSNHVFQHNVVMCEALGLTEMPKGFVVHHIDGNKKNNDISNLCLLQMGAHSKLHQIQNKMCKVQRLSENGVEEKSSKC